MAGSCKSVAIGLLLAALAAAPAGAAAPPSSDATVAQVLKAQTQALLDAIAPGDRRTWDRYLAPEAIQVDENDVVRDRAQILADLQPLGPGREGNLTIDDFRVVRHGDLAVVTHEDAEYLNYFGQVLLSRFRNTDTWRLTPEGWRLVASQVLAVQKDPPATAIPRDRLCAYAGRYALNAEIAATIRCEGDGLVVSRAGRPDRKFLPETADTFFELGQPRSRRMFQTDASGAVTGFIDRREGRDILWRRLAPAASGEP